MPCLVKSSIAAGAYGQLVEVHHYPDKAYLMESIPQDWIWRRRI